MRACFEKGDGRIKDELEDTRKVLKLSDVATIKTSKRVLTSDYKSKGVPFLKGSDLAWVENKVNLDDNTNYITKQKFDELRKKNGFPKKGDILVTGNGTIGKTYLVDANDEFYFKDGVLWVTDITYDNDFLYMYIRENVLSYVKKLSHGSTITNLNIETLRSLPIPQLDTEEQRKIGQFLSLIDDLIAHNEERARNIKKEKEFITAKLITNSNDLDTSIKTIGDILYIPQKDEANNVDMTKILRLGLHTKGLSTLAEDNTLLSGGTKYYYRKAGDFIFGKQNIFNGSVGIIPNKYDNYLSSGDVPTLRFKDDAETYFFMHFVSRKNFYNGLEIFANGTGSKRIHEKDLLNIKIKYPNNRKQIANLLSTMDENINLINERIDGLKQIKQHYLNVIFK